MKRLSTLILVFAIVFSVFFLVLVLLRVPFRPYPLMSVQDALDILTPLVLLPLYWLMYRLGRKEPVSLSGLLIFIIFAALWAEGHGMHLSANSLDNLLQGNQAGDFYKLTYFYDEVLSHYIWHTGIVGLSALLIYRQWRGPITGEKVVLWPLVLAGVIHGFTYFLVIIEAGTAPLGVTFTVLALLFILTFARKGIRQQPLINFFFVTYALAALLFFIWGIYWQGLPQPSELGLI
jgi:hypothetical protein